MDDLGFDMDGLTIPDMDSDAPTSPPSTTPERPSVCVAFQGVGGGAGVTTLAIATAHVFAQAKRGDVCLVDLDFALGMCGHYLDVDVRPDPGDLQVEPHRVDSNFMRALLSHHDSGFSVLAAPGGAGLNDRVDPRTVLAMMDALSDMFSVLVLDVPRLERPWTEAALRAADRVCLVSELNIPALHVTRMRLDELSERDIDADVVLNKYERRSFRASIRKPDAERALGRDVTALLGGDAHAVVDAMNCGLPATVSAPDSRYCKDVATLARELSPHFAERRRNRR